MEVIKDREKALQNMSSNTRQRIEAAVLTLFSAQEFHKVKLIDVATEARVSLQTIYKYYGNKETLLFSSLDVWLGELAGRMIDHLRGIENYKDRLRKVFWVMLDYFESHPDVAQIIMTSVYLNTWRQDDTFRQPELMSIFIKVLGEGREQGVLSDEVAERDLLDFILGVAQRSITMWLARGQHEPLTAKAPVLFDMIWRAIARSEHAVAANDEPALAP